MSPIKPKHHKKLLVLLLASLWVSACVLLPDNPCEQDSDCPLQMQCYEKAQCLPAWWVKQTKALQEQTNPEPPPQEREGNTETTAPEPAPDEPVIAPDEPIAPDEATAPDEPATPDASPEIGPEPAPEKPTCECTLGQAPAPCFPKGMIGCTEDGQNCKGVCKAGTKRCIQLKPGQCPEWDKCEKFTPPATKRACNKQDDNCDGTIDEGCKCTDGETQACYPHKMGCRQSGVSSFTCVFPCTAGTQTCTNGNWTTCSGDIGPKTEICDGKDNNCDGNIDETFPNTGKACKTSGKGICEAGKLTCASGKEACKANQSAKTELCGNKADDDCDGKTDEGCVSTFAGTGKQGKANGPALTATFNYPRGLTFDKAGNLYIADTDNHLIRKIDTKGVVSTFAGTGTKGDTNGPASQAQFSFPSGISVDISGNVYVSDTGNNKIKHIANTGQVTTISGNNTAGFKDGIGAQAAFDSPTALTLDGMATIYVTDNGNHSIRKIGTANDVSTFAGAGLFGFFNGPPKQARFAFPGGLALQKSGNLYVADTDNHLIRKIDINGNVTTFAGAGGRGYKDGASNIAKFDKPTDLAFNTAQELFVVDNSNCKIRKITTSGMVTTFAGGKCGDTNGPIKTALLSYISSIAINGKGDLYVIENNKIKKVSME